MHEFIKISSCKSFVKTSTFYCFFFIRRITISLKSRLLYWKRELNETCIWWKFTRKKNQFIYLRDDSNDTKET